MNNANMENGEKKTIIDVKQIIQILWKRRKSLLKIWTVTFIISCIWIFPEPRYYECSISLAPEIAGEDMGGIASIASSFGINFGAMGGTDAIGPTLYPDLFESPEFTTSLFNIQVETADGEIKTDYYTYLKKHQKKNWLLAPFRKAIKFISKLFSDEEVASNGPINPFRMSKDDWDLVTKVQKNIKCSNDKKTDVTTISVKDQDALVSALLADSVSSHLQNFIIEYRTKKTRKDMEYYKALLDSSKVEYDLVIDRYCAFVESHKNSSRSLISQQEQVLNDEVEMKKQAYIAFNTQYQSMAAKLQERTPVFTTLKSASVPIKPDGPKRVLFVAAMLILASLVSGFYFCRNMNKNNEE